MDRSNVQEIQISSGTIVRFFLILILFFFLYILKDIALILITAIVVASAIEPLTQWFTKQGLPRVASVLTIYLSVAVLVVGVVYFLLPPLVRDSVDMAQKLPTYIESLAPATGEGALTPFLPQSISLDNILGRVEGAATNATGSVVGFVSTLFGGIVSAVVIIVLSFYLAVLDDGVAYFLRVVTPPKYESYIIDLWKRSRYKIGRWLQGQLLLSLFVGILVYVALMLLGVPNALLLALLAAALELIPMFGPIIAAVPAIAIGATAGGPTLGLLVAAVYFVIQQLENHVLVPLVVKKVVGVPSLVVIIALLVGGKLAGFIGLLISVPLAATLMEFYSDVEKKKREAHDVMRALD